MHTSYWAKDGGDNKRRSTFIEYSKNFIDYLHVFHSKQSSLKISSFTKSVNSIHYYDSIIVIEKKKRKKPFDGSTGKPSFINSNKTFSSKIRKKLTELFT